MVCVPYSPLNPTVTQQAATLIIPALQMWRLRAQTAEVTCTKLHGHSRARIQTQAVWVQNLIVDNEARVSQIHPIRRLT